MAVIPFDPQLFGNASNNGRMLGEMDAKTSDRRRLSTKWRIF